MGVIEVATATIDQINVHPAVIVVVKEGAACANSFRQVHFWRTPVGVNPRNAASGRRNFLESRRGAGRQQSARVCTKNARTRQYTTESGASECLKKLSA